MTLTGDKVRHMNSSEDPPWITLEWATDQPERIMVRDGWRDEVEPSVLLNQLHRQMIKLAQRPGSYRPSLGDVRIEDLGEFALLIQEARDERHRNEAPPVEVRTRHFTVRWLRGRVLAVTCQDEDWMRRVVTSELVEELMEACTPPPPDEAGTAQKRLERFVSERKK